MVPRDNERELTQLCHDYRSATGIGCRWVSIAPAAPNAPSPSASRDGTPDNATSNDECLICKRLVSGTTDNADGPAGALHRLAAYFAERYGGRYVYLCRWSLLHWASPIVRNGMLIGALVCGPALLFEPDSHYIEELQQRGVPVGHSTDEIVRAVDAVPRVTPEGATSLSNILFHVAIAASDRAAGAFFADREAFEQQSRIGEYLQHIKTMEGEERSDLEYPFDLEQRLIRMTENGDHSGAITVLDELMGAVFVASNADLELMKSRVLELTVLLSRAAVRGGADVEQVFGLNYHYLSQLRDLRTVDALSRWTRMIIARFTDLVFTLRPLNHSHVILRATRYLRSHFAERLTLAGVASQVDLSPTYFGKLFRIETGCTFTDYVTNVRIEAAQRLLLCGRLSLADVAWSCGFEDPSYFSKVFKRTVGTTPSRYRATGGRLSGDAPSR